MNLRRWLHEHSLKLLAIRDTPEAIAGGVAIGVFFGFAPIIGLKTLTAIAVAWLTRCNILAAVLAATVHDVMGPLMAAVYFWEYSLGHWILFHKLAPSKVELVAVLHHWWQWKTLVTIGKPALLGGVLCGAPPAVAAYFVTRRVVARHQQKKAAREAGQTPPPA